MDVAGGPEPELAEAKDLAVLDRVRAAPPLPVRSSFTRSLLDAGTSEQKLAEVWLEEGNAYYDPRSDGVTMTDWFRTMLETLDR
ncbi:hypothetical protein [Streptomyces sp. NPDC052192]|uniref:hypothetical protein n=1 Tax=Streptomyces sp. NPDC052192 TaxID=3155052 RepID=UPI003418AD85